MASFVDHDRIEFWVTKYLLCKELGKPVYFETKLAVPGKKGAYAYCCVTHVKNNDFIVVMQEITQLKLLEEQLRESKSQLEQTVQARTKQLQEALEVKSRFLATMSHGTKFLIIF